MGAIETWSHGAFAEDMAIQSPEYSIRVLNRIGEEIHLTAYPMYVDTLNSKLPVDLSILVGEAAILHGGT